MKSRKNSKKWAVIAFVMILPWWLSSEPRAASQAKLAISAVVTNSANWSSS